MSGQNGTSDIVIDVRHLTKTFGGRSVVDNLTLQVRRGSIYGFLGPNGSGKTTTMRMLCGLLTPEHGNGTCLGYDIRTETDKIKAQVGYMTQRFSLYEDISVRENLEFIARIYGIDKPADVVPRGNRAAGLVRSREGNCGRIVWRLETAAGTWRLYAAWPAITTTGRTDRRRRFRGAPGILERDPCARRRRPHRAHLYALHRRG